MRFATQADLAGAAELHRVDAGPPRTARLVRWAELLRRIPDLDIHSLGEIEFVPEQSRDGLRREGSALSLAFADPVFRSQGLLSDTYGEGVRFFDLSDREAHWLLCSCSNGLTAKASYLARKVERLAQGYHRKLVAWLGGLSVAVACAAMLIL
ncbi:hypothetical protein JNW90_34335 [Micromonospora sp. STR1s_5]|nr:hypothetical protein [Micromonospora sp. STR1s_5]